MSTEHRNRDLIERLLGPAAPEVSCDECFERLDQYVDLELAGEDADGRLPGMRAHLDGCPACREEYPHLKTLDRQYRGRGVQVISVPLEQTREEAVRWARDFNASFPVIFDPEMKIEFFPPPSGGTDQDPYPAVGLVDEYL